MRVFAEIPIDEHFLGLSFEFEQQSRVGVILKRWYY